MYTIDNTFNKYINVYDHIKRPIYPCNNLTIIVTF